MLISNCFTTSPGAAAAYLGAAAAYMMDKTKIILNSAQLKAETGDELGKSEQNWARFHTAWINQLFVLR